MGDVLMTTPAMAAVADAGCEVTLLTSPAGASVAPYLPMVDETIVYDAPWTPREPAASSDADRAMISRLKAGRYDAAIIFTVCTQDPLPAALMTYLADIPLRLAHEHRKAYGLLTHPVPDPEVDVPRRHEVERQLDLVRSVGYPPAGERMVFEPSARARRHAEALVAWHARHGRPRVVVHPGARSPSRRYTASRFGEVCELLRASGCSPVLVGSAEDAHLLAGALDVSPQTPVITGIGVATLGALLAQADIYVGNNSGPAHLAAAVGTPSVVMYAGTNLQHTPWGVSTRVLRRHTACTPCLSSVCPDSHHPCLDVPPHEVADSVFALLAETDRAAVPVG